MLSVCPSVIGPLNYDVMRMRMTLSSIDQMLKCKITPAHSQNNHIFYFTKSESMFVRWMYANTLAQIPHLDSINSAFQCGCFLFIYAHSAAEWSFISYLFKLICLVQPVAEHLTLSPKTQNAKETERKWRTEESEPITAFSPVLDFCGLLI